MSFKPFFAAIAVSVVASVASAEGHTQSSGLLSNFSIGGFTTGDVVVNGSPNTVISAFKDGFNDSQISLDFIGEGCGADCTDVVGNATTSVYELAAARADTVGDVSGELFGSSTTIDLTSGTELQVADTTLRDTSSLQSSGNVAGVGIGDDVTVVSFQDAFGKVQQDLAYHGSSCPDNVCGNTTQGAWVMGGMSQAVHVTATGHEAIAIGNATSSSLTALLDSYKEVGPQPAD